MPRDITAITLRPARADDALCLGVLATQVFLDTYATDGIRPAIAAEVRQAFSTDSIAALLAREDTRLLVAEDAGHLVGFAQVTPGATHACVASAAPAELDRLYVQEPYTGRGLGRALLQAAEACASDAGATDLWLTPWVHNQRALRFYARCGYADCGMAWFHLHGEQHENRVLSRRLSSTPVSSAAT
jgi:diamine N-acetyltransferase